MTAAAGAVPAHAQSPLPDDNAGTGQYIEPVPDAGGDRPSSPGGGSGGDGSGGGGGSLPPSARRALPAGEEGRQLESLATDPGSGAPAGDKNGSGGRGGDAAGRSSAGDEDETAVASVVSSVLGGDGAAVPVLFLTLALLTLAAGAMAVRRRGRA